APRKDGRLTDTEHATGIAVPAVLDDGDINVDDVAIFKGLVTGYAMADDMIDGRADGAGKRRMPWRGIAHRGRSDIKHIGYVIQTEFVELGRGDAGLDVIGQIIQRLGSGLAGGPHLVQVGGIGNQWNHKT